MEKFRNIPYNDKRHMSKRKAQKCISLSIAFTRDSRQGLKIMPIRKCISSGTGLRKAVKNEECI